MNRARLATGSDPVIVCNAAHRFLVEEQLAAVGAQATAIICEPVGRNTAPAVGAAAAVVAESQPSAVLLVLPSDHSVSDGEHFARDVATALPAAAAGHLLTFGIDPTSPQSGYGYIRRGPSLAGIAGVCAADEFVEKPDLARARSFVREGKWLWNSGMFLLPADLFVEELTTYEPLAARAAATAVALAERQGAVVHLDHDSFALAPSISIDYAVMERTDRAAVLPTRLDWSDVGAWSSLWSSREKDPHGNVAEGDVLCQDVSGSYVRSDGPLVAVVGLTDVTVVATKDAVLVADREHSQAVRQVVTRLRGEGRAEADGSPVVRRPWGTYESIDVGPCHQVKHIVVKPGHKLSLQRHEHRAEHWVVVSGTASVVRGDDVLTLHENDSVHVPVGCVHRVENQADEPLHFIEVQVGDYLGEDDIERLADEYGRS